MKIGKIKGITPSNNNFTSVLTHIHTTPKKLHIAGTLPEERPPTIAIIGTRKPSHYGKKVTYQLAYDLAKAGFCVISGLAMGVDSVAHQAALDARGHTIAILAHGLHRIYPAQHQGLAETIVKSGGALMSEYDVGTEARKHHFLARNRLISGLADAILVTEATAQSGTQSTVTHAIEQGKDIFAVPGPITSLISAGPNTLIQQGAHVALSAKDIISVVAPHLEPLQQVLIPKGSTPLEDTIITLLFNGATDGEDLLVQSKTEAGDFMQAMTMLEINGIIKPLGGNVWALR